ncbi:OmpA family protein [Hymenobacter taeanensis]|uniref:OmpA family protein n=1 Tax=Hymenobacter taeanensis TaxID=2735321 RepID=A0A6M6BHM1_9BACT|nr:MULTISPECIES: OmpA family protein [Hymenobacter]QJX47284.1 OmpA family protein [Hymenobacter taeanensis]UOQ79379.1 OmpA family protein [Hymenobacter sp. 5414T-23]
MPLAVKGLLDLGLQENHTDTVGQLAHEAAAAGLPQELNVLTDTDWGIRSSRLMERLLANAYGMTLHCLAAATGTKPVGNETLLGYTMAMALGALGQYVAQYQWGEYELYAWLKSQEAEIVQAVPAYSRLPLEHSFVKKPALLPASASASTATVPANGVWPRLSEGIHPAPASTHARKKSSTAMRWQLGGLLLLAVGVGYLIGHDDAEPPTTTEVASPASSASLVAEAAADTPPNTSSGANKTESQLTALPAGHYNPTTDTYIYDTGHLVSLRLADGTIQQVGVNSTESKLYQFLSDPKMQVDSINRTKGWINCDRVYFEPGQAILTAGSGEQLRNIASILRTFPTARIKFGGYTDSTGNSLKNFQLSENRAKAAMLALGSIGIDISRIEAKGYGAKFFLTTNTTPEGRAMNRRVSLRVIRK